MMRRGRSMAEKCLMEAGSVDTSSKEFHCDGGEQRQPTEDTESRRDFVFFKDVKIHTCFQTMETRVRG